MDVKKTPQADLENKKTLFFSISLVISMSLVVMAFQWKQYDSTTVEKRNLTSDNVENEIDVPVTDIAPPPVKTIQQPQIVEVPDEKKIEEDIDIKFDAEVTEDTKVEVAKAYEGPKEEEPEVADQIFLVVEQPATPKDGIAAFYRYVSSKLVYPAQARRMEISGKVFVEFVINKDGSITDVRVVKGIGGGCDEEAARIIADAPAWNAAKQRGKPVKQRMVLPIMFTLRGLS
jgi:periplasmic protein TonB